MPIGVQSSELEVRGWPVRSWSMSTERLVGVSARLLTGATVVIMIGLGLSIRSSWQQTTQSFGPDGTATGPDMPFANRAVLMVMEFNYRPIGFQILLASALVTAAVVALHRHSSWGRVRWLRWEVLGAELLVFVAVVGLVLLNVYVMTAPLKDGDMSAWFGGEVSLTGMALGNLTPLVASLLVLAAATLWWLRLGRAPEDDRENDAQDEPEEPIEPEPAAHVTVPEWASEAPDTSVIPSDAVDGVDAVDAVDGVDGEGSSKDWSKDWSPEDFRPPR